jgi:gamma-glutamyltranspeptidase/glutathione hydrolase
MLRFHHQLLPENTIYFEPYAPFPPALRAAMQARGYRLEAQDYNGDVEAIQVVGGRPQAASDPRGRGVALIVR